jgi:hypothetical protein
VSTGVTKLPCVTYAVLPSGLIATSCVASANAIGVIALPLVSIRVTEVP